MPSAGFPYGPVPRGGQVWLEGAAPALLIVHALAGIALLGSTTHNAVLLVGYLRGRFGRVKLEKLYVRIQLAAYLATFLLGSVIYPAYRIYVRAAVFDRHAVWASNLFDIKENLAAMGLPLVVAFALLSRTIAPRRGEPWMPVYTVMGLSLAALVWIVFLAGLVVVSERGL